MRIVQLIIVSLALAACGDAQIDTSKEAQDAFEEYVSFLNAGDTDKAAAMYDTTDGFHWIERGIIQYENGADAAASLRALSETGGRSNMTIDSVRVAELGDTSALVSAHFDFVMFSEENEEAFSFDGWMTVGMIKREEGWRIAGGQTGPGSDE